MMERRHKKNLVLALDILEKNKDRIKKEEFKMSYFFAKNTSFGFTPTPFYNKNSCGTISCACGHIIRNAEDDLIPTVGDFSYKGNLSMDNWGERVFGPDFWWDWQHFGYLFSGSWKDYDNTLEGVIDRMESYILNGYKPLKDWEQKREDAKKNKEVEGSNS